MTPWLALRADPLPLPLAWTPGPAGAGPAGRTAQHAALGPDGSANVLVVCIQQPARVPWRAGGLPPHPSGPAPGIHRTAHPGAVRPDHRAASRRGKRKIRPGPGHQQRHGPQTKLANDGYALPHDSPGDPRPARLGQLARRSLQHRHRSHRHGLRHGAGWTRARAAHPPRAAVAAAGARPPLAGAVSTYDVGASAPFRPPPRHA